MNLQINLENKAALKYYQPIQKYIRMGDGTEYVFVPKVNISMAWVDQKHVNTIMSMKRTDCNCSSGNPIFRIANEQDVRIWSGAQ